MASPSSLQLASRFVLQGHDGRGSETAPLPDGIQTFPQLFAHTVLQFPNRPALSSAFGGAFASLSYSEVACKVAHISNSLRARLHDSPGQPHDRPPVVGIWMERSMEFTLAVLAVTYAGATWLPFDPDAPVDRVSVCLEDSDAVLLLCDGAHHERAQEVVGASCVHHALFDDLSRLDYERTQAGPMRQARPGNPAYLIYTSGTTGTPKGISIPHKSALAFIAAESSVLGITENDTVWQGSSPAFDIWIEETWISFARGAHVVVGTREECRDTGSIGTVWERRGISVVSTVPTLMGMMSMSDQAIPECIRIVILGGEACPASLVEKLASPGRRLLNTYGPTETTVTATWAELIPGEPVTIGRPLPSYHALLLRADLDGLVEPIELEEGCTGELAIGGPTLGLGYVNRLELTAQKFVKHPLFPGERLYRTGDLVSLDHNGCLRFLGRIDTQVKLRGFRIELGEIEECLVAQPGIQIAAVVLASEGPDDPTACLEAYIVTDAGHQLDPLSVRQGLTTLPSYMRPEKIFQLDKENMPRLPSGKINSHALRTMSAERRRQENMSTTTFPVSADNDNPEKSMVPLSILINALQSMFPHASPISPDADFFLDLGGHSLLAAVFVNKLRKGSLGVDNPFVEIGIPDIYAYRTARALSHHFETDGGDGSAGQHLPLPHLTAPRWKYLACNAAQLPCLLVLWFLASLGLLGPYLLFALLVNDNYGVGLALLAAYAAFVVISPLFTFFALCAKWALLGRVEEGDHPLWGWYYLRWWFAERLCELAPTSLLGGTPLLGVWFRMLGADIGQNVILGGLGVGACADLVSIGEHTVMESECVLGVSFVEGGLLKLRRVHIGADVHIGANCVLEGHSIVEDAAELGALSMVPSGCVVTAGEKWIGCPARFDSHPPPLAPPKLAGTARQTLVNFAYIFTSLFLFPLFYLVPQISGIMLFEFAKIPIGDTRPVHRDLKQTALMAPIVGISYTILVVLELLFFRWTLLGRVKPGRYSVNSSFYVRNWFVNNLMSLTLSIIHPVFATVYAPCLLRALGAKIGSRAEVSTAQGMTHDLVEIGAESFIADGVLFGDSEIRRGELVLERTKLGRRAFAGNASVIPQGTDLAENTLVGALSIAPPPDRALKPGQTSLGSPPLLLPTRQTYTEVSETLTFSPSKGRFAARATIEAIRIFFPRVVICFGLGTCLDFITYLARNKHFGIVPALALLPLHYLFFFALPALVCTLACKWLLVGVYKDAAWPMWDHRVWVSEAVTAIYKTLADPLLLTYLRGTAYLPFCLRLFGAKVGTQAWINMGDVGTEYDCVSIGDHAQINHGSWPQTHLFEDRVMKIGRVTVGDRAVLGMYAVALPGSVVGRDTRLGSLSLAMRGETLPDGTEWRGSPASLVKRNPAREKAEECKYLEAQTHSLPYR
ncbi:hypothetical protein BOTBODRAFT_563322 [Botryobasidium botryosum FD-172 SS1]|uniref:Carrier domain-containing protein n=1 Tax=Botryobasidium botryosum (strain FD-172 SS1) TaxID=930990 RepID=A0A067LZE8_BOTB1|nr:hypothetical protein BOTBODRAFT_563322 [Botryobasidium botryosum FD-172 SS1]